MTPVVYLYVPGDRPERFSKAINSGAGAVILDLEDSIALTRKSDARDAVVAHLAAARNDIEQWVRINAGDRGGEDLDAIAGLPGLTGVVVPKATARAVDDLGHPDLAKIALVESAAAMLDLPGLTRSAGVQRLAMGEVDLAADLGIDAPPDAPEFVALRLQVVVASAASGLDPPIGPVHVDVKDVATLRATTKSLLRGGFESRQVVHPSHVQVVSDVMTPDHAQVEHARQLLRLAAAGGGGVHTDSGGRMIDEAVLRSARRLLARADRASGLAPLQSSRSGTADDRS